MSRHLRDRDAFRNTMTPESLQNSHLTTFGSSEIEDMLRRYPKYGMDGTI